MLTVFTDSRVLDLQWLPAIKFNEPYTVCHSLTDYINAPGRKIAFTMYMMGQDYHSPVNSFESFVNQLSQNSEAVFCFDREMSLHYFDKWNQCTGKNVYWLTPAFINEQHPVKDRVIFWGDWFETSTALYKALPDVLSTVDPYKTKSKYFDALLGLKKPNRTFVYENVNKHNLTDQIIMTYNVDRRVQPETGRYDYTDEFYAKDYFIWEPGTKVADPIKETANYVQYQGQTTRLSQIIPVQVYNDTAYSIVAETDFRNEHSFYTEKTAKALMARRLFVAFSGRGFLSNLQSLGFKTFGDIIDESYDNTPPAEERWAQAFEQVRYLCGCDQQETYAKIKPIAEHNYNLIMNQNWNQLAADKITNIINHAH